MPKPRVAKKHLKVNMDPYKKLSCEEIRLARMWHTEDHMEPCEIAGLLRRDVSTMTRLLVLQNERKQEGRPVALDGAAVDKMIVLLDHMVVVAGGRYEVTVDMLRRRSRSKVCNRTISDALHSREVYFRRLREKPVLSADDIKARKAFGNKYKGKTCAWWTSFIDIHIDVKHFPVFLNGRSRDHAAREGVRGACRTAGQGLEAPYAKHGKKYKYNPGARGAMVLAGIGHGKV